MHIVREDLAWAAGFFDGEGSVVFHVRGTGRDRGNGRITMTVSQIDRRVLDKMQSIIGLGYVRGPYSQKTENSSCYWVYSLDGFHRVQYATGLLWTWLSDVKRIQASEALVKFRILSTKIKTHCSNNHELTDETRCLTPKKTMNGCRICRSNAQKMRFTK